MKNSKFFVFLEICLLGLGLASCGEEKPVEPDIPAREKYTISFDLAGGVGPFAATKVEAGEIFNRPNTDPVKENYNFISWYVKGSLTAALNL